VQTSTILSSLYPSYFLAPSLPDGLAELTGRGCSPNLPIGSARCLKLRVSILESREV
jgi:hypothetical protein